VKQMTHLRLLTQRNIRLWSKSSPLTNVITRFLLPLFTSFSVIILSTAATMNISVSGLLKYEHLWVKKGRSVRRSELSRGRVVPFTFLYFAAQWSPGKGYLRRRRRRHPYGINCTSCNAILHPRHRQSETEGNR